VRTGLAVLAVATALRLVLAARLGLAADEAYYWTWSEDLALAYYDHPAGVAGLIRAGTTVLGDTELGVRAGGLILQAVALGVLLWHHDWSRGLLLLFAVPAVVIPAVLATPDVGLLSFWILAIVAAERERWLLAGVLAAAALWFKLPALILIGVLAMRSWRTGLLALALGAPSLAGHALFQLDHGLGRGNGGLGPMAEFIGAQAGFLGPLLFIASAAWLVKGPRDRWWWSGVATLVAFGGAALFSRGEGNWGLPFCLAAVVGCSRLQCRWARVAEWGGWTGGLLSVGALVHAVSPWLPLERDPLDQLHQGRVIGEAVGAWGVEPVLAERYQEASWVRFYGEVDATTVPGAGRASQFDLDRDALPEATVVVRPRRSGDAWPTDGLYTERSGAHEVHARRGDRVTASWQVAEVEGYDPRPR